MKKLVGAITILIVMIICIGKLSTFAMEENTSSEKKELTPFEKLDPANAQCDLLRGLNEVWKDTLGMRRKGIPNQRARIHATKAQWGTFKTFPLAVQEQLKFYIKEPPVESENEKK